MMDLREHVPALESDDGSNGSTRRNQFVESAKSELKQLGDQLTAIREQIESLQTERKRVSSLAHSLRSYLRTQTGDDTYAETAAFDDESGATGDDVHGSSAEHAGPKSRVADAAFEVLADLGGKDMHYHELTNRVISQIGEFASTLNGCRVQLNTALNADARFVRPYRRGHYALRRDHPTARSVGKRQGRRRRG